MSISGRIDLAARLTRAGKLTEAVSLLAGRSSAGASGGTATKPLDAFAAKAKAALRGLPVDPEALRDKLQAGLKGVVGGLATLDPSILDRGGRPIPVPGGATFEARRFSSAGQHLDYKLYRPSRTGTEKLPLVVMLHGCTQSPEDFALGTRMNELAESQGVLVAYPAQSRSANSSKCWNWFRAEDQERDRGEPALIAGMVREFLQDERVDPHRVYVAGLSAGGAAAAVLGQAYPDLFAAVGVHSGLACGAARDMAGAFAAMKQGGAPRVGTTVVPTVVFHGDADATVSPINGAQVIAQAQSRSGLRTTVDRGRSDGGISFTRTVQADAGGVPVLEHWVLHGAGHAWSGGSSDGSYTDPRGPDASAAMLRFFSHHTRGTAV